VLGNGGDLKIAAIFLGGDSCAKKKRTGPPGSVTRRTSASAFLFLI
jgi:hypothetical protein